MKIAIIGAARQAGTLSRAWVEVGHTMTFGVRKPSDPEVLALVSECSSERTRIASVGEKSMTVTIDRVTSAPRKVLMAVASLVLSTTLNSAVGFWAHQSTLPYYELTERRFDMAVASPEGRKVELDAYSDLRLESYWSWDLISMGFLHRPTPAKLQDSTTPLAQVDDAPCVAILICGSQYRPFGFGDVKQLQRLIRAFDESERRGIALKLLCREERA